MGVNDRNYHYNENGAFPLNVYTENNYTCDCYSNRKCPAMNSCKLQPLFVTDVAAESHYTIDLIITYSDGSTSTTTLTRYNKYVIKYVENGLLKQVVGVIVAIGKVNDNSNCTCECCNNEDFLIKVDASVEYNSNTVIIRTSSIRDISIYTKYADENSNIENATIRGASFVGNATDVKIINCTIDESGKISAGTIIKGTPDMENCTFSDGCVTGLNSKNHEIVVIDSKYCNGLISDGKVLSGYAYEFTIEGGETDTETGITTDCTMIAERAMIISTDITAFEGVSYNGTVIDPTIINSTVVGGDRTGADMITTGGIAMNGIYYSGTTEGGNIVGGTASGFIGDKEYVITNGITKDGFSTKTTVEGAIIEGGKIVGSSTIGAIAKGGIAKCGVSFEGTTVLGPEGIIKPGNISIPAGLIDTACAAPDNTAYEEVVNELIIWLTAPPVGFGSNISVVTL